MLDDPSCQVRLPGKSTSAIPTSTVSTSSSPVGADHLDAQDAARLLTDHFTRQIQHTRDE